MPTPSRDLASLLALALLLTLPATASATGALWIVDASGGPGAHATEIQEAVDLAASGDTVLVRSGSYQPFTVDAKALVITADVGAEVLFFALPAVSTVRNLPAGERVVLAGLGPAPGVLLAAALRLEDNDGSVWLQDCHLRGASQGPFGEPAAPALSITGCAEVMLTDGSALGAFSGDAGTAVSIESSAVAIYDAVFEGGRGANGPAGLVDGLPGGPGLVVESGQVFLSGTEVRGGDGGDGGPFEVVILCGDGGDGGAGLVLGAGHPAVTLRDTTVEGGAGGDAHRFCAPGAAGLPIVVGTGAVQVLEGASRSMALTSPVREQETVTMTFQGQPGDAVHGLLAVAPDLVFVYGSLGGAFGLASPQVVFLGAADAGGQLAFTTSPIDPFAAGVLPLTVHVQVAAQGTDGAVALTGGRALVLLDDATP